MAPGRNARLPRAGRPDKVKLAGRPQRADARETGPRRACQPWRRWHL